MAERTSKTLARRPPNNNHEESDNNHEEEDERRRGRKRKRLSLSADRWENQGVGDWRGETLARLQILIKLDADADGLFVAVYATPAFIVPDSRLAPPERLSGSQGRVASGTMNRKWGARLLSDFWSAVISWHPSRSARAT